MKQPFVLFVVAHLVMYLAMPSLPGAFRFNSDESVVGIRVQPVQAHELRPAAQLDLAREALALPRVEMKTLVEPHKRVRAPNLIVFLPRRDPSPDRSLQRSVEDD